MLTLHATLQPDGHIILPEPLRRTHSAPVLVTFLDEPEIPALGTGTVAATLALLQSPAFRALPKGDPAEIEQRIAALRADWKDD
jgi:hypothetical protein